MKFAPQWFANCFSQIAAAILDSSFLMAAAYAGCDAQLAGLFFILSVGAQGMIPCSTLVVPTDLSPNFSGPISALTNGIACINGFVVPFVIGQLTPNVSISNKYLIAGDETTFYFVYFFGHSRYRPNGVWFSGSHSAYNTWKLPIFCCLAPRTCNRGIHPNRRMRTRRPICRVPLYRPVDSHIGFVVGRSSSGTLVVVLMDEFSNLVLDLFLHTGHHDEWVWCWFLLVYKRITINVLADRIGKSNLEGHATFD